MEKTVFKDAEEFVQHVEELKPFLAEMRELLRLFPNPEIASDLPRLESVFANDSEFLHEQAARLAKPDGRIELGFTQDAFLLLRQFESGGRKE